MGRIGRRGQRDPARGLRRALILLAAAYAATAGLGTGTLVAAGGFAPDGGSLREARAVGTLRLGAPPTPSFATGDDPAQGRTPQKPSDPGRQIPEIPTRSPAEPGKGE